MRAAAAASLVFHKIFIYASHDYTDQHIRHDKKTDIQHQNKYQNRAAAGYAMLIPNIKNNPPRKGITVQDLRRRKYAIRSSRLERDIPNPAKIRKYSIFRNSKPFEIHSSARHDCSYFARRAWMAQMKRANKNAQPEKVGRLHLVAWGGIEPPTQGFSVLCSTD